MDLSLVDWIGFLIFNIGNPAVEAVPTGTRLFIGLLQAIAVRNAGFQVVPLAVVAPAVKYVFPCFLIHGSTNVEWSLVRVLYLVMMYIAIYPIALR